MIRLGKNDRIHRRRIAELALIADHEVKPLSTGAVASRLRLQISATYHDLMRLENRGLIERGTATSAPHSDDFEPAFYWVATDLGWSVLNAQIEGREMAEAAE